MAIKDKMGFPTATQIPYKISCEAEFTPKRNKPALAYVVLIQRMEQ